MAVRFFYTVVEVEQDFEVLSHLFGFCIWVLYRDLTKRKDN